MPGGGALPPPPPGCTLGSCCPGGWGGKRESGAPQEQRQVNLPDAGYSQRCHPPPPAQPLPSLSHPARSEGRGWDRAHAGPGPLAKGPLPSARRGSPRYPGTAGSARRAAARRPPPPPPPGQGSARCVRGRGRGQAARTPQELRETRVPPIAGEAPGKTPSPRRDGVRPPQAGSLPRAPARAEASPRRPQGLRPRRPRESPRTRTELAGEVSRHVLTGHLDPSNGLASLC